MLANSLPAHLSTNDTLEQMWAAATQAAADFPQRPVRLRRSIFALALTEATQEIRVRCCSRLIHLHGGCGEVGVLQQMLLNLVDARRFWNRARRGDLELVNICIDPRYAEPTLETMVGQFRGACWYLEGYRNVKRIPETLEMWPQVSDALLWHYGPGMAPGDEAEWKKYEARWEAGLKTTRAWEGLKDEG